MYVCAVLACHAPPSHPRRAHRCMCCLSVPPDWMEGLRARCSDLCGRCFVGTCPDQADARPCVPNRTGWSTQDTAWRVRKTRVLAN
eukprot:1559653-Prymnesium_polylepis.1